MPLTDADHIRSLLGTYCRLIDAGDFTGVGRLMAEAVLMTDDGTVIATGADEVAALYSAIVKLYDDGTPGTQHVVANTSLEEIEGGAVRARSAYVVFQAVPGLPLQTVVTGSYVDTFEPDSTGTWRFVGRRFAIGRSGDLTHHLVPGVTG
ncbi:MAG: hypothetical protein JWR83_763 [Aeromicrobium sp.]|nr:hypothetical protein [Aeromicrobium sp.]